MPLHSAPRWCPVPGRPPAVPSSQGEAILNTEQQQRENTRHLGALAITHGQRMTCHSVQAQGPTLQASLPRGRNVEGKSHQRL